MYFENFLGYYCDIVNFSVIIYFFYLCLVGYYCLNGIEFSIYYFCFVGTYNFDIKL